MKDMPVTSYDIELKLEEERTEEESEQYELFFERLEEMEEKCEEDNQDFTCDISEDEIYIEFDEEETGYMQEIEETLKKLQLNWECDNPSFDKDTIQKKCRNGKVYERFCHPYYDTPYVDTSALKNILNQSTNNDEIVEKLKELLKDDIAFDKL